MREVVVTDAMIEAALMNYTSAPGEEPGPDFICKILWDKTTPLEKRRLWLAMSNALRAALAAMPEEDADARAKQLNWERCQCFDAQPPGPDAAWEYCNEPEKNFWRKQAAKEAGDAE